MEVLNSLTGAMLAVRGGLTVRVRSSALGSTFFSLFFNPCVTAYGLPSLADNSKYMAVLLFIF